MPARYQKLEKLERCLLLSHRSAHDRQQARVSLEQKVVKNRTTDVDTPQYGNAIEEASVSRIRTSTILEVLLTQILNSHYSQQIVS